MKTARIFQRDGQLPGSRAHDLHVAFVVSILAIAADSGHHSYRFSADEDRHRAERSRRLMNRLESKLAAFFRYICAHQDRLAMFEDVLGNPIAHRAHALGQRVAVLDLDVEMNLVAVAKSNIEAAGVA